MKKNLFKVAGLLMFAIIMSLGACKKDDADFQSAEDAINGNYIMADAFKIALNSQGNKSLKGYTVDCYVITPIEGVGFDIEFTECTGDDGIYRDGILEVRFTSQAAWTERGNGEISVTFKNYFHEDYGISGTISAGLISVELGFNFIITSNNLVVTYPNGDVAKINSSEYTFTVGLLTIELSGNSTGINRRGVSYSTVTKRLKFYNSDGLCPWPTNGTIVITIEGEKDIIVDYDQNGESPCDNIVLVSQKKHKDVTLTLD